MTSIPGVYSMRRLTLLALAVVATSCSNGLAERQAYLSRFIGQPESAVVQQMGVPNRSIETGGVKYLAYDEHRVDFIPGTPGYSPFYWGWYGAGFPPQVVNLNCETTFELTDGTVKSFTLRGNACG
jgi:hypothetical protein